MSFNTRALPTALVLCVGLVAACGSSSSSATPDAGSDGGNLTPPSTVSSLSPTDGDSQVSVRTPIEAHFTGPVQIGGTPVALMISSGSSIATSATLSSDQTAVAVSLTSPAKLGAETKVTARFTGISDAQGRALDATWSWTWPLWLNVGKSIGCAQDLKSDDCFSSYAPAVAAGPGDRVTVAIEYHDKETNTTRVSVQSIDGNSGTWTPLGGPLDPKGSSIPNLIVDKSGRPLVLFVDSQNNVRAQRWDGSAWSDLGAGPLGPFGQDRSGWFRPPSIAMDAQGRLFVTYATPASSPGTQNVVAQMFGGSIWEQIGGTVNDPAQSDEGNPRMPQIALDKSGRPYVVYAGVNNHVRAWSDSDKAWKLLSPNTNLPGDRGHTFAVNLAIDDGGTPFVLGAFGGNTECYIRRFDAAHAQWVNVGDAIAIANGQLSYPALFAVKGGLFAVDGDQGSYHAFDVTSSGWTPVDGPKIVNPVSPGAALDPNGVPVVAWWDDQRLSLSVVRLNR